MLRNSTSVIQAQLPKTFACRQAKPASTLYVKQIIDMLQSRFQTGYKKNKNFIDDIKAHKIPKDKLRMTLEWDDFPQYTDQDFESYNANKINTGNTLHLIAAAGPTPTNVARFIKNIVFNEKVPIKEIIALGSVLLNVNQRADCYDFGDYGSGAARKLIFTEPMQISGLAKPIPPEKILYTVKIEVLKSKGKLSQNKDGSQIFPEGIIQSKLRVSLFEGSQAPKVKDVNVTFYKVDDNHAINLVSKPKAIDFSQSTDERKEILWQLFLKSYAENLLIHCAQGVGRTGHLIATFLFLANYQKIFIEHNHEEILRIVERMRENRPALIATREQFTKAIENAHILYCYALKKGYIKNGELVSQPSAPEPSLTESIQPARWCVTM